MSPQPPAENAAPAGIGIGAGAAGQRLDRALGALVPEEGLRGRRRRIAGGGVLLNGRICREPARRLRAGDALALAPLAPRAKMAPTGARLLARQGEFCFLFKPCGLHSAALAGKAGDSLEARLPGLCAPLLAPGERPELLQRLDQSTSGIVCAALTPQAARDFRAAEAAGKCEKRYLALLRGGLAAPVTARAKLDTSARRVTRLMDEEAEALRRTEFFPLHVWRGEEAGRLIARLAPGGDLSPGPQAPDALTLAACRIRRGSRHQIRAHAAGLGHPLAGDGRYAGRSGDTGEQFLLHHGLLAWPGHGCSAAPPWPWLEEFLPEGARQRALAWLSPEALLEIGE